MGEEAIEVENGRDDDDDDDDDEEEVARGTYEHFNEDATKMHAAPSSTRRRRARRVFDARCSVTRARSDLIIWYKRCDGSRSVSR